MDVAKRIKEIREKIGFTQNKLAEWSGVSQSHLRRVELGDADITVGHLRMLCDAMGVSLYEFFEPEKRIDDLSLAVSNLSPKQKQLLVAFLQSL